MEQFLSIAFGVTVTIVFGIVVFEFIVDAIHSRNKDDEESEV